MDTSRMAAMPAVWYSKLEWLYLGTCYVATRSLMLILKCDRQLIIRVLDPYSFDPDPDPAI